MKRARKQYTTQLLPKWRMVDNHWLIRTLTVLLLGIIIAGWRYGFVASLENGNRVYNNMGSKHQGELKFEVPDKTTFLWLVVSGAPTEHWAIPQARSNEEPIAMEQWAYKIRLNGTSLDPKIIKE